MYNQANIEGRSKTNLFLAAVIIGAAIIFSLVSCTENKNSDTTISQGRDSNTVVIPKSFADTSILGTIKANFTYELALAKQVQTVVSDYYQSKHAEEIIKTLEIAEVDTIPNKDFVPVFFRYSIGADIVKQTYFMIKLDDKWFINRKYYSEFDDDPFNNNKPEHGKALLKKMSDWKDGNENIWWY